MTDALGISKFIPNAGLYIIESPLWGPVGRGKSKGLEMGKEFKGEKREKKKIGGKYNFWQYQIINTDQ